MSTDQDLASLRVSQHEREIKRLRRTVTLLDQALAEARTVRTVKPLRAARTRRTTGDIVRVIVPDSHGSSIDEAAAGAFLGDLRELDPHEIILQGDHVDCGGFLAQHHTLGYVAETEYSYEEDALMATAFLDGIQHEAGRADIDYLEGNHEERIERWAITQTLRNRRDSEGLRRHYAPEFKLELAQRGIRYRRRCMCYDGVSIPGTIRRGACYFTHGFSTAKNAAAAHLHKIAGNIVFGHTHRAQVESANLTNVGTVYGWGTGCLCRLQPLWQHTNPTSWTHGYAVQFVDRRTGYFFHVAVPIVDGVSMFRRAVNSR